MKRLRNIFGHPYVLIVHRGWRCALCHRVAIGLCDIAETRWECCRGASNEVFQRERLSSSKLCHDIGEREGEVAQVLPGWLGSQEGIELVL